MLSTLHSILSFCLFLLSEKYKPLCKQAHGDRCENIHHRVLFDKSNGNTDHPAPKRNADPHPLVNALLPEPCRGNSHGICHMKGRTHTGIGIKSINDAEQLCQNVIPWEHLRPQILPVWKNDIHRHGNDLSDDDIGLHLLKAVHAVQQEIQQRSHDQQIPAYIRNYKPFAKRHHIVQPTMHRIAVIRRDQILGQKI